MEIIPKLYLSYSPGDLHIALSFACLTKNTGLNLWMDRLDHDPEVLPESNSAIIDRSSILIALVSKHYLNNAWGQRELEQLKASQKPVIYVLIEPLQPDLIFTLQPFVVFTGFLQPELKLDQIGLALLITLLKEQYGVQLLPEVTAETGYLNRILARIHARSRIFALVNPSNLPNNNLRSPDSVVTSLQALVANQVSPARYAVYLPETNTRTLTERLDVVDELTGRLYVIGSQGSGKTALIEYQVLRAVRARKQHGEGVPLPLFISTHKWNPDQSIAENIRTYFHEIPDALPMLLNGKATLWLDGVGESVSPSLSELEAWLRLPENRLVRAVIALDPHLAREASEMRLPTLTVLPLQKPHIEQFVSSTLGEEAIASFQGTLALVENALVHLALDNAFWLSAFTQLYIRDAANLLTQSRATWIRSWVALLHEQSGGTTDSLIEFEWALSQFARTISESEAPNRYTYSPVAAMMGQSILDQALRTGILYQVDDQVYFSYSPFLHYFAAGTLSVEQISELVTLPTANTAGALIPGQWDASIVYFTCLTEDPDSALLTVISINPFLAVECVLEGAKISDNVLQTVLAAWIDQSLAKPQIRPIFRFDQVNDTQRGMLVTALLRHARTGDWHHRQIAIRLLLTIPVRHIHGLLSTFQEMDDHQQPVIATAIRIIGEQAIPALLHALYHQSWKVRRGAVWALAEIGDVAAVPALVELTQDVDPLVVKEVVESLGRLGDNAGIAYMAHLLYYEEPIQGAAVQALAAFGMKAVDTFLRAFSDINPDVRRAAVSGLKALDDERAFHAIIAGTHDEHVEVRAVAIEALGSRRNVEAVKRLIESLADHTRISSQNQRISDLAISILRFLGVAPDDLTPDTWSKSSSADKRKLTSQITAEYDKMPSASIAKDRLLKVKGQGQPEQAPPLDATQPPQPSDLTAEQLAEIVRELQSDDPAIQMQAIRHLVAIKDDSILYHILDTPSGKSALMGDVIALLVEQVGERAIPALLSMLQHESNERKATAIQLLRKTKSPQAVNGLATCLNIIDEVEVTGFSGRLCDLAARTLLEINTPEAVSLIQNWRKRVFQAHAVEAAVRGTETEADIVAPRDPLAVFGPLLDDLTEGNWEQQLIAAKQIVISARDFRDVHHEQLNQRLISGLDHPDWSMHCHIIEVLAWLRDKTTAPALRTQLDHPHPTVRIATLHALAEVGETSIINDILAVTEDSQPSVREAAAEALGILRAPAAVDTLIAMTEDRSAFVRLAAVEALAKIPHPQVVPTLLISLDDLNDHVRWAAARALSQQVEREHVNKVLIYLHDTSAPQWEDKRVCDWIAEGLRRINSPESNFALENW